MIYLINNTGNTFVANLGVGASGGTYSLELVKDDETYTLTGLTDTSFYVDRYSLFYANISTQGTGWFDYSVKSGTTILDSGLSFVKFNEPTIKVYSKTSKIKSYSK